MFPKQGRDFFLVSKNDLFAFNGLASSKTKTRLPIPQGDRQLLIRRIRCDFQGRLARFKQLHYSSDMVFLYLLLDMAELVRLGYSITLLNKSWQKTIPDPSISEIGTFKPSPGTTPAAKDVSRWQ